MKPEIAWGDILGLAVNAPSGDNAQPWRFSVEDNRVTIFNVPDSDATLYNFQQRGSYLAHGALVENIVIAASRSGLRAEVEPFPGDAATARVTLTKGEVPADALAEAIEKRATNRKPYGKKPLDPKHRDALVAAGAGEHAQLRFIEGAVLAKIAAAVSTNERLLFENKDLHDFLFNMIRWTEAEEKEKPGLYVLTMEFPAPLRFLLKHVFSHWGAVQALNKVGLSRAIPKSSSQIYAASSAFGALIIEGERDVDFFTAGRALQRVWLTATSLGLSFQPITALPYLRQRIKAGEARMFSDEHIRRIEDANSEIAAAFGMQGPEHIAMLFRIGYDGEPTARSAKLPPVYV